MHPHRPDSTHLLHRSPDNLAASGRPARLRQSTAYRRTWPTTSVLIHNYNNAAHLEACLESVLAQSHAPTEVIVYDSGSTDQSLAILLDYAPRITVITGLHHNVPPHLVQARAIHEAFIRSTGEVVFLLNSHDLFSPTKIERFLNAFQAEEKPVLVQAPMAWINDKGQKIPRLPEPFKHTNTPFSKAYQLNDPDLFYPTSSLAFRRDFLQNLLPLDSSDGIPLGCDARLCHAALLTGPISTLTEELGAWRHGPSSSDPDEHSRTYLIRQTWRRTQVFNRLSREAGQPTISLWQNPRLYRQALRLIAPRGLYDYFQNHFAGKNPVDAPPPQPKA